MTALMLGARDGHLEVVQFLTKAGADLATKNDVSNVNRGPCGALPRPSPATTPTPRHSPAEI